MPLERLRAEDSFENETFSGLDLQRADLADKEFYRCVFLNCLLQESSWKSARLEACAFRGCDLTRAKLAQTAFRGVEFEGSKLMGIEFGAASLHPEFSFTECNLRYASFVRINLRKIEFTKCTVREVNFVDADLTEAEFSGSDLTGASIQGCTLALTDFRNTTGLFFEPSANRVKKPRVPMETAVLIARHLGLVVEP